MTTVHSQHPANDSEPQTIALTTCNCSHSLPIFVWRGCYKQCTCTCMPKVITVAQINLFASGFEWTKYSAVTPWPFHSPIMQHMWYSHPVQCHIETGEGNRSSTFLIYICIIIDTASIKPERKLHQGTHYLCSEVDRRTWTKKQLLSGVEKLAFVSSVASQIIS